MEKRIKRCIKIYPWYSSFTGDLLFYIAIDTLFLTLVKGFSAAEIVSIYSISQLICIGLQFPILFLMKKIGNTASLRTGALLLLLSAVFTTFGNTYFLVLLGRVMHDSAAIFKNASIVMLENNLELIDRREDFVRARTSANTVYSVITMLIAFVASYMFTLNNYLPMAGCIACALVGFLLSVLTKDYSSNNKPLHIKKKTRVKLHYSKFIIVTVIAYSVFYAVVSSGQNEGKLFIQEHLFLDFNEDKTALILGAIICVTRVVRVISNVIFAKVYRKYQGKMGAILASLLCISMASMVFGSFIPQVIVKILVMSFGYTIILFARDPYNLYTQDVVFLNTPKEQHETLLVVLNFGMKIATVGLGLVFSAILLSYPLLVVISILLIVSVIEIILSIWLYRVVMTGKQKKQEEMV